MAQNAYHALKSTNTAHSAQSLPLLLMISKCVLNAELDSCHHSIKKLAFISSQAAESTLTSNQPSFLTCSLESLLPLSLSSTVLSALLAISGTWSMSLGHVDLVISRLILRMLIIVFSAQAL